MNKNKLRVLVGCEFSGIVRDAFLARGHDAVSCDLLPTEQPGPHIQGDVFQALKQEWDLMIAFPPCTHLAVSGARWFKDKLQEQSAAIAFVGSLMSADVPRIAIENPIGILSTHIRKPDQIVHPWMFGHGEVKATCLWLKNLPLLNPTNIVEERKPRVHHEPPSPDRWKNRSRTLPGLARAMAAQWSEDLTRLENKIENTKQPKRRIKQNVWGNWYGYEGNRRVIAFPATIPEQDVTEWLQHQENSGEKENEDE